MMSNTRSALLDSAEARVKRHGFDAVSFADLGEDVGIRKASIHYHFPSKSDLSLALIDRYHTVFLGRLKAISERDRLASAQLLAFLDLYRDALEGGRSLCLCLALSVTQQALPDDAKSALADFHREVTDWLQGVFRLAKVDASVRGVTDPYTEAYAALAQVEGAQIITRSSGDPTRFEAAIDTLRRRAI